MEKLFVSFRFQPNSAANLRKVIDFLIQAEKRLKIDEDAEVVIVCEVNTATINIGTAKLKPTLTYDKNEKYEVIPEDFIPLYGVLDKLNEQNEFVRIFPKPTN